MQAPGNQWLSPSYSPKMKGLYTGERLERDRPEVYTEVVELLACGTSVNYIAQCCRVSRHTIRAVRKREADSIAQFRVRLAFKCSLLAEAAMDQIQEALEAGKVSLPLLIMIADKSTDMFLKLTRDIPQPLQPVYDICCQHLQPIAGLPPGHETVNARALQIDKRGRKTGPETHLLAGEARDKKD